jgi:hypothetical protein
MKNILSAYRGDEAAFRADYGPFATFIQTYLECTRLEDIVEFGGKGEDIDPYDLPQNYHVVGTIDECDTPGFSIGELTFGVVKRFSGDVKIVTEQNASPYQFWRKREQT